VRAYRPAPACLALAPRMRADAAGRGHGVRCIICSPASPLSAAKSCSRPWLAAAPATPLSWLRFTQSVVSSLRQIPAVNVTTSYRCLTESKRSPRSLRRCYVAITCLWQSVPCRHAGRSPRVRPALSRLAWDTRPGAGSGGAGPRHRAALPIKAAINVVRRPMSRETLCRALAARSPGHDAGGCGQERPWIGRPRRGPALGLRRTGPGPRGRARTRTVRRRPRAPRRPRGRSRRWWRGTSRTAAPRSRARVARGRTGPSPAGPALPIGPRTR
jgi:hypothetical protein